MIANIQGIDKVQSHHVRDLEPEDLAKFGLIPNVQGEVNSWVLLMSH